MVSLSWSTVLTHEEARSLAGSIQNHAADLIDLLSQLETQTKTLLKESSKVNQGWPDDPTYRAIRNEALSALNKNNDEILPLIESLRSRILASHSLATNVLKKDLENDKDSNTKTSIK